MVVLVFKSRDHYNSYDSKERDIPSCPVILLIYRAPLKYLRVQSFLFHSTLAADVSGTREI